MPGFGEPLPHAGDVDVAVGQVRGLGEGIETSRRTDALIAASKRLARLSGRDAEQAE